MKPEVIALVGTLIGALVGAGSTLVVTWIRSRVEERKHLRQLVFQAGTENWKQGLQLAMRQGGRLAPLEDFLVNMAGFAQFVTEGKFDKGSVESILQQMDELNKTMREFRARQREGEKSAEEYGQG